MPQQQSVVISEDAVLAGLSKKLLKDRRPFVLLAATMPSDKIFAKLASMYLVLNDVRVYVFQAMKDLNVTGGNRFAAPLGAAMWGEFQRLRALLSGSATSYLTECLWYCIAHPDPGFDQFVNQAMALAASNDAQLGSEARCREVAAVCWLYLAIRDVPGGLEKVAKAYMNSDLLDGGQVVELFTRRKDPMLYDTITAMLLAEPQIPDWTALAADYMEYSAALGREPNVDVVKRFKDEEERASSESSTLLHSLYGKPVPAHDALPAAR